VNAKLPVLLAACLVACQDTTSEQWRAVGPAPHEASVVVVFVCNASPQDISRVSLVKLSDQTERGQELPRGVNSMMKISVEGHAAYALGFERSATAADIASVKQRLAGEHAVVAVVEGRGGSLPSGTVAPCGPGG
jgi:hypothetical protein